MAPWPCCAKTFLNAQDCQQVTEFLENHDRMRCICERQTCHPDVSERRTPASRYEATP